MLSLYELTYRLVFSSWLVMMLNFSGAFSSIKQALLLILIFFAWYEIACGVSKVSYKVCVFITLWVSSFFLSYIHGLSRGYDDSWSLLNYIFLTPIICYTLSSTINLDRLFFLNRVLILSLVVAIFFSFLFALFIFGMIMIPDSLLTSGFFGGVKISSDILEMRMSNQSALIFLIPYVSTLLVFHSGKLRWCLIILVLLSLSIVMISGRRALQFMTLFGFFLSYIVYVLHAKKITNVVLVTIAILILFPLIAYGVLQLISVMSGVDNPIDAFVNTISMAFDSSQKSTRDRSEQVIALLEFWNSSPVWGHGLNSYPSYLRSQTDKWSYEFVYLAFFSQNGIILGMLFLSIFFLIWRKMWFGFRLDVQQSRIFIALLVGSICYFIAAGTNPMIQFYWFWVVFLVPLNKVLYSGSSAL